ncbi:MAG: hypothetical protein HQL38_04270 [Alphaproteobacteria bacterium]|nr:hypothetical protein [Alphaproteobacteria bacterium]MBF0391877.1 hypothetical protein [Alphaproteobacteria bacterium]
MKLEPMKKNPLKLNPLQLKTLTLFQELARHPDTSTPQENGAVVLTHLPQPHGNHFHVGSRAVATRDASGLSNQAVWTALERKGMIIGSFPYAVTLTPDGLSYETGLRDEILHGSDH